MSRSSALSRAGGNVVLTFVMRVPSMKYQVLQAFTIPKRQSADSQPPSAAYAAASAGSTRRGEPHWADASVTS